MRRSASNTVSTLSYKGQILGEGSPGVNMILGSEVLHLKKVLEFNEN